jgi:hypothetical protein
MKKYAPNNHCRMNHNPSCVDISYLRNVWKPARGKQRAVLSCGDYNHEVAAHEIVL